MIYQSEQPAFVDPHSRPATQLPKNIFLFWDTYPTAPPIVTFCIDNAKRLNVGYNVRVINGAEADEILSADFSAEVLSSINVTQKSDVLRTKLLVDNGGVWMDATGLLHEPLDLWLGAYMSGDMTAVKETNPIRVIGAWFIAARKGAFVMSAMYETLKAYWATPKLRLPTDDAWHKLVDSNFQEYISDYSAHVLRIYPYFFYNYLFARNLETDPAFAAEFSKCRLIEPLEPRGFSAVLRALKEGLASDDPKVKERKRTVALKLIGNGKTPMSKLTWKHAAIDFQLDLVQQAIDSRSGRQPVDHRFADQRVLA